MKSSNSWMRSGLVLAIGTVCIAFARNAGAQVQTTTTTTAGQSSQVVKVDRGEVLAVEGNDLMVRMADGSIRHFENIPESAKATVGGKQLGIHALKPGMKLERTITTTTTPQIVTTVSRPSPRLLQRLRKPLLPLRVREHPLPLWKRIRPRGATSRSSVWEYCCWLLFWS
jgi:hypothetical protein